MAFSLRQVERLRAWVEERNRALLPMLWSPSAPLDLRFVGRVLLHAALVGVACGLFGAAFFALLEWLQRVLMEDLAGYVPLRAHGERHFAGDERPPHFRWWILIVLPALGGLLCGLVVRYAPEAAGGGGDATINAFHNQSGIIRRRVLLVKPLASLFTLATGGAGGREGPTMLIGGALGSLVARLLQVSARERRILLIAGVAAGISAVFRTPLGAALLAVEFLYKDGFESDALVPSVLASVVSYSIVVAIFGESTLFATAKSYPFFISQLPLYIVLALCVAALALLFLSIHHRFKRFFQALPVAPWLRPAIGGLMLGLVVVPVVILVGNTVHVPGQGLGLFGGGYGAVQAAISGAPFLKGGFVGVGLLLALAFAKMVTSSITIGSGGSAGDFAPSLAIGGLFGGAFGRLMQILLDDPSIDPGAFALVGMGAFYGGIAHVPLSALVLVCELAGTYDLLVPLMLALTISFVACRKHSLYGAQVPTQRESPVHRDALVLDLLKAFRVEDVMARSDAVATFHKKTTATEMLQRAAESPNQDAFPVVDESGLYLGLVGEAAVRRLAVPGAQLLSAGDLMQPPVSVRPDDHLRRASERMVSNGLHAIPVVDANNAIIGVVDERDIARTYLDAARRAESSDPALRSSTSIPIIKS